MPKDDIGDFNCFEDLWGFDWVLQRVTHVDTGLKTEGTVCVVCNYSWDSVEDVEVGIGEDVLETVLMRWVEVDVIDDSSVGYELHLFRNVDDVA